MTFHFAHYGSGSVKPVAGSYDIGVAEIDGALRIVGTLSGQHKIYRLNGGVVGTPVTPTGLIYHGIKLTGCQNDFLNTGTEFRSLYAI